MAQVAVFDIATNRFKESISNVFQSQFTGRLDVVIYQDDTSILAHRALIQSVPAKYLIHEAGVIREMTSGEKAVVDSEISAAAKAISKTDAKNSIDGNIGYDKRALAKVLVDEINVLRQWLASFKTEVAAASNLADLKTRVAGLPATPDRTLVQAKTAYKNLLDGISLDE